MEDFARPIRFYFSAAAKDQIKKILHKKSNEFLMVKFSGLQLWTPDIHHLQLHGYATSRSYTVNCIL